MKVSRIAPAHADLEAWERLAAEAAEPNPFFEPAFILPAARHLPGGRRLRLLVVSDADGWYAAAPVVGRTHWRNVPALMGATWIGDYGFLGSPLAVGGAAGDAALRLLLDALRQRRSFAALELLPEDGATAAVAQASAPGTPWLRFDRPILRRRPVDDYEQGRISRRHRRRLHVKRERLSERLGHVTGGEDDRGVSALLELEASGWKGRAGSAMRTAGHEPFFRAMCDAFAAQNRLQPLVLFAGDRPVATQINLIAGDGLFCFKIAYDETLSKFSPGALLEFDALRAFHARTELQWADSCAGPDNALINQLWPDRRPIISLLVAGRGPLGRAGRSQVRLMKALHVRRAERAQAASTDPKAT